MKIEKYARQHIRALMTDYPSFVKTVRNFEKILEKSSQGVVQGYSSLEEIRDIESVTPEQIAFYSLFVKKVDEVMNLSEASVQAIIELRYFQKEKTPWVAVSMDDRVSYSEDNCYKLERKFIDLVIRKLGWA